MRAPVDGNSVAIHCCYGDVVFIWSRAQRRRCRRYGECRTAPGNNRRSWRYCKPALCHRRGNGDIAFTGPCDTNGKALTGGSRIRAHFTGEVLLRRGSSQQRTWRLYVQCYGNDLRRTHRLVGNAIGRRNGYLASIGIWTQAREHNTYLCRRGRLDTSASRGRRCGQPASIARGCLPVQRVETGTARANRRRLGRRLRLTYHSCKIEDTGSACNRAGNQYVESDGDDLRAARDGMP